MFPFANRATQSEQRNIGLWRATSIGVGAIVGGGILALAGTALAATGPSAVLAFLLNGLIALMTALSLAEMSSRFPESGGIYTFAKKAFSIEAAFSVGWVVWFASITAAALYALGFAYFSLILIEHLWGALAPPAPAWLGSEGAETTLAVLMTALVALVLAWRSTRGGVWVNVAKVLVFAILIVCGLWAIPRQDAVQLQARMSPFFSGGFPGLIQAMGYTFIAMQGFDLIAAVGGDVRSPSRNIPRAMILSLLIALAVYLPMLLIIALLGPAGNESIVQLAGRDPEAVIAIAAERYLGSFGYWLVIVGAVLATLSALQANLFAASHIVRAMACDRTFPAVVRLVSLRRGTPYVAISVTALIIIIILVFLENVATAGAASGLIFLIVFALAHWIAILIRQRSNDQLPPFRTPWFPVVPAVGALSCLALAVFLGLAVPAAGMIILVWLVIGGGMFMTLLARRARVHDAVTMAQDPELVRLRGQNPRVLVPVANPGSVRAMVGLAHILTPVHLGRLTVLSIVVRPEDWIPEQDADPMESATEVARQAISAGVHWGVRVEAMMIAARDPVIEIARVANRVRCDMVVVGFSRISEERTGTSAERLLSSVESDVVVLRAADDWDLAGIRDVLVLVAGRGGHDTLRARLLGSLMRVGRRRVTYLRVLPEDASPGAICSARSEMTRLAADETWETAEVVVQTDKNPIAVATRHAQKADLVVLGVQRVGKTRLFGRFTRRLAQQTECPMIVISHR